MSPWLMNSKEKVKNGAAFLDEKVPGWREKIDVNILIANNCYNCILGQLFGSYRDGITELNIDDITILERCGFAYDSVRTQDWIDYLVQG